MRIALVLISEREAARRLAAHGTSLSASQHLLATGIAGRPVRTHVATLYDGDRVDELVARPHVRADEFVGAFPVGVVIARLSRARGFDVAAPWTERVEVMAGPWRLTANNGLALAITVNRAPGYPLLLSVAGHVVDGARIVGLRDADGAGARFELEPPGEWLSPINGRRLRGHRGPQLELVGWTPSAASGHTG